MASEVETRGTAGERLREQVGTVREDLKELGGVAREAAREKIDVARERAKDAVTHGRERAETEVERLSSLVRERPLQSMAIAIGVGVLLGALFSRRR